MLTGTGRLIHRPGGGSAQMSDRDVTRRQALEAATAMCAAAVCGCGYGSPEKPERARDASEVKPMSSDPAPTLGWETIASGKAGPGPRSRHGLVYDRNAKAAVLFGGIIWDGRGSLQSDTWELHD